MPVTMEMEKLARDHGERTKRKAPRWIYEMSHKRKGHDVIGFILLVILCFHDVIGL